MPRPLPTKDATKASKERKKSADEPERDWHASHTAFEELHTDLGRIAALIDAAYNALEAVPRLGTALGRRRWRVLEELVCVTQLAVREALREYDHWIDNFEGRPIYYDGIDDDE